jgi:hypothetical protein
MRPSRASGHANKEKNGRDLRMLDVYVPYANNWRMNPVVKGKTQWKQWFKSIQEL